MSVNLTSDFESLSRWFHIQTGFVKSSLLTPPAQDRSSLQQVFQTLNARSCPKSYNFHLHTRRSDGQLEPYEVMEQAIEIGLKGLTITDHHSTQGYKEAQKWLDNWKHKYPKRVNQAPRLWTGVEINARLLAVDVHILGYAFDPDASSLQPYLQGCGQRGHTPAWDANRFFNRRTDGAPRGAPASAVPVVQPGVGTGALDVAEPWFAPMGPR